MLNIIVSCCVKDKNKILMVQENKKDIEGKWDFPGGKLEETENIFMTAKREIMEETGYKIDIDNILLMQNYVTPKGEMLIIYFNSHLIEEFQCNYRKDEIKNVKWLTIDEIKEIPQDKIRGNDGFLKLIYNIENNINYPLDIFDIHDYLN